MYLNILILVVLLSAFQNCAKVNFAEEASKIDEASLGCVLGESRQCLLDHGKGIQTCDATHAWTACSGLICDPGFTLTVGKCELHTCPFGVGNENACSNKNEIGFGTCSSSNVGVNSCEGFFCRTTGTIIPFSATCPESCVQGESCKERNGVGSIECSPTKTCELSSCEAGFVYDAELKACVSEQCSGGQTQVCQTEFGHGSRKCTDGRYDVICEPDSCPSLFRMATTNGYKTCLPILCASNQYRTSSGSCATYTYSWETSSFGACSATCGGGTQSRTVTCKNNLGQHVADSFCPGTKPATSQSCNTHACATYSWDTSSFGACSVTCGGGTQTRAVTCKNNSGQVVADSFCSGTKPATSQSCNTQACVEYGTWSSPSCSRVAAGTTAILTCPGYQPASVGGTCQVGQVHGYCTNLSDDGWPAFDACNQTCVK